MKLNIKNPFTSLFGKIFLWFWLTVILMLVTAFFIGKLVNDNNRISLADASMIEKHQRSVSQLQSLVERGVPIHRAVRRSSTRRYPLSTIIDTINDEIVVSFPETLLREPKFRHRKHMMELSASDDVLIIRKPPLEIMGPFKLEGEFSNYVVFNARVLRRDEQLAKNFLPALIFMLVVGTVLCAVLAWRLATPLKQFQQVIRHISQGNLETKLIGYDTRRDEIGQLAKDFNQMSTRLSQSIEQQQRLMANISHELRTPLTRLHLASAMLAENASQESIEVNANRIENEIQIMDKLIGQAIELARMSLGELSNANKPSFVKCSLEAALAKLTDSLSIEVKSASKKLIVSDVPEIELALHLQSFDSCIENILRNALRFAKEVIQIDVSTFDNRVKIFISDDGKGATKDAFANFLKPFNYANDSAQVHNSYGLGLAIADAGAKMHGGGIQWAPSRLGGLTVLIEILIDND